MMVEIIDKKTMKKMMAMIMGGFSYQDDSYIIYCIRREHENANIFVSKLLKNSQGYVIDYDFDNGEKQILDKIVQRLLSKENRDSLENDGFTILKNITLEGIQYFDIDKCYVSTVPRSLIKDCLIFYELVHEKMFEQPIVEVIDDKRKFNEGFVVNIGVIFLGIFVLVFSIFIIVQVLMG